MYRQRPKRDAQALAAMGLSPEDFATADQPLGLWPENLPAVALFASLDTQWRVGFAGPIGLDYSVLPIVFRLRALPRKDWPGMFDDLRAMETEALKTINASMSKKD
jgi:hypothetical protein